MEIDLLWVGLGLAAAGYFIGEGLKNFGNSDSKSLVDSLMHEEDETFIKEKDLHYVLGLSKDDAKQLIQDYPDVPHIKVNGNLYFQRTQLLEWMSNISKRQS